MKQLILWIGNTIWWVIEPYWPVFVVGKKFTALFGRSDNVFLKKSDFDIWILVGNKLSHKKLRCRKHSKTYKT